MLEIRDLRFRYGKRAPEVLKGVSLTLPGGVGVLLGQNGAGKSTLFRNVLGIEKPASGTVLMNGTPVLTMSARERARHIAYVPQRFSFGDLTVFDTVMTGRLPYFGLRAGEEDEAAVERALREMDLLPFARRSADRLSGGEKQKVAIARAIAGDPELIIFDEPTGNLDLRNEQLMIREVKKLATERGVTVLCSLHDLNEAIGLGDRFFFMRDGEIRYAGGKEWFTEQVIRDVWDVRVRVRRLEDRVVITGE